MFITVIYSSIYPSMHPSVLKPKKKDSQHLNTFELASLLSFDPSISNLVKWAIPLYPRVNYITYLWEIVYLYIDDLPIKSGNCP